MATDFFGTQFSRVQDPAANIWWVWQHGELVWDEAAHADWARALRREVERVGAALHEAGYFGPFGVDAFTWRDRAGALRLQPRSEVNARWSMGFAASGLWRID